jgi:hypothetical protein
MDRFAIPDERRSGGKKKTLPVFGVKTEKNGSLGLPISLGGFWEWFGLGAFFAQRIRKIPRFEDGGSVLGIGIGFGGKDFSAPDSRFCTFGILGLGSWDRMLNA